MLVIWGSLSWLRNQLTASASLVRMVQTRLLTASPGVGGNSHTQTAWTVLPASAR